MSQAIENKSKQKGALHTQTWGKGMLGDLGEAHKIIFICIPRCKFGQWQYFIQLKLGR